MPTKKPNVRIQPRDIEIFRWLQKFRFLTAYQIAGLVDPVEKKVAKPGFIYKNGQDAIMMRVKLLKRAGYLNSLTKIFQKYVYTLGPKAVDHLVLENGTPREEISHILEQKKRSERHINHTLMIAEFGATLALACKYRSDIKLAVWLPESNDLQIETHISEDKLTPALQKLKRKKDSYGLPLNKIPDAVFGLQNDKEQYSFFILEADRGTETTKTIQKKIAAYYSFWQQKKFAEWSLQRRIHPEGKAIKNFRVLTYTVTPQWQETLIKTTIDIHPDKLGSGMFWFTNQK
jgi:hypothetical protein